MAKSKRSNSIRHEIQSKQMVRNGSFIMFDWLKANFIYFLSSTPHVAIVSPRTVGTYYGIGQSGLYVLSQMLEWSQKACSPNWCGHEAEIFSLPHEHTHSQPRRTSDYIPVRINIWFHIVGKYRILLPTDFMGIYCVYSGKSRTQAQ